MIKPIITERAKLTQISYAALDPNSAKFVIADLKDTVASLTNIAGLAAPQIGELTRIILVKVQGKQVAMINPVIEEFKGKKSFGLEGCFSVPSSIKKPRRVKRFYKIKVRYITENSDIITKQFKGFEARLIQHEVDHLNGVII